MELLTDGHTIYEYAYDGCTVASDRGLNRCPKGHARPIQVYELDGRFTRRWQLTVCRDADKLYPYTKEDADG